jgi:hypothetical protein
LLGLILALTAMTGTILLAAPASAAVPDAFGFVLWYGGTTPPTAMWPPATTVVPGPPGLYRVTFPGQAAKGGVVHVTAVNDAPVWCQVEKYGPAGLDEVAFVGCYRIGGAPVNSGFAVIFASSSGPPAVSGGYAYVAADAGGGILSEYNSSGSGNGVGHSGIGTYEVKLPGLGSRARNQGSLQVTAVNSAQGARCKVAKWATLPGGQLVSVACFDSFGAPLDTDWNLSLQDQQALYGGFAPPKYFAYLWNIPPLGPPRTNINSIAGPGVNTLTPAGTGLSLLIFPAVAQRPDDIQVTAYGATSEFCNLLTRWVTSGPDVLMRDVACYDTLGSRIDTGFFASYNSAF